MPRLSKKRNSQNSPVIWLSKIYQHPKFPSLIFNNLQKLYLIGFHWIFLTWSISKDLVDAILCSVKQVWFLQPILPGLLILDNGMTSNDITIVRIRFDDFQPNLETVIDALIRMCWIKESNSSNKMLSHLLPICWSEIMEE